jgi:CRP/FNR family transcriptional regulator
LAQRAALRGEPDNPVFVPMVRADVADYLGVALETVSRILATLHQKKLIELSGAHHIHLTAPDRLRELVEGADLYRER